MLNFENICANREKWWCFTVLELAFVYIKDTYFIELEHFYMVREEEKENETGKPKLKIATKSNQKSFFT